MSPSIAAVRGLVAMAALFVCGCPDAGTETTGSGDSGTTGSTTGFDCPTLRDKQAAASCPKFDGTKYLSDCEATKSSVAAACKPKLDALADCIVKQPIGCTDAGTVNDETPPACKSAEDALNNCH